MQRVFIASSFCGVCIKLPAKPASDDNKNDENRQKYSLKDFAPSDAFARFVDQHPAHGLGV